MSAGWVNRSPPWTTRWPTACTDSTAMRESAMAASASSSARPIAASDPSDRQSTVRSKTGSIEGMSRTVAFSVAEPAFRTSTRRPLIGPGSVRPGPVADLGGVLAELTGVGTGAETGVDQVLSECGLRRSQARHPIDDIDGEMEPVEVVAHDHVE